MVRQEAKNQYLRIIGYVCYVYVPNQKRRRIDWKAVSFAQKNVTRLFYPELCSFKGKLKKVVKETLKEKYKVKK